MNTEKPIGTRENMVSSQFLIKTKMNFLYKSNIMNAMNKKKFLFKNMLLKLKIQRNL